MFASVQVHAVDRRTVSSPGGLQDSQSDCFWCCRARPRTCYTQAMKLLSSLFRSRSAAPEASKPAPAVAPNEIASPAGGVPLRFVEHLYGHEGLPIVDWSAVEKWLSDVSDDAARQTLKAECQRAWLLHLRDALGSAYELNESTACFVLAPYEPQFSKFLL